MTENHWQAVVFDMDGLLIDSSELWGAAEGGLLAARGFPYTEEARSLIVGLRMRDIVGRFREHFNLTDSIDALYDELRRRVLDLSVELVYAKPGADDLLAYLAQQHTPCAIASSSPLALIDRVVENLGWEGYFTAHCSGDSVPNGKPAPDVYLKAADLLGIAPGDCLALEDSVTGARAATTAGMTCFAVPEARTPTDAFAGITSYTFESLHHVKAFLAG